jgi:hypothetical protein
MTLTLQMISLYEEKINKDYKAKNRLGDYAFIEQKLLEKHKNILYNNRNKRDRSFKIVN